jgi:hypothetical protein
MASSDGEISRQWGIRGALIEFARLLDAAYDSFEIDITTKEDDPSLITRIQSLQTAENTFGFTAIKAVRTPSGVVTISLNPRLLTCMEAEFPGVRPGNLSPNQWGALAMRHAEWAPSDIMDRPDV